MTMFLSMSASSVNTGKPVICLFGLFSLLFFSYAVTPFVKIKVLRGDGAHKHVCLVPIHLLCACSKSGAFIAVAVDFCCLSYVLSVYCFNIEQTVVFLVWMLLQYFTVPGPFVSYFKVLVRFIAEGCIVNSSSSNSRPLVCGHYSCIIGNQTTSASFYIEIHQTS